MEWLTIYALKLIAPNRLILRLETEIHRTTNSSSGRVSNAQFSKALGGFSARGRNGHEPMCVNWQAVAAIATTVAVLIALYPIFQGHRAARSKAINLRLRLATKLYRIRPSLNQIANPNEQTHAYFVVLDAEGLVKAAAAIEELLAHGEALKPSEQDKISQIVANLELMIPAFAANTLPPDGAQAVVTLIDEAISELEKHGIAHGESRQPWAD